MKLIDADELLSIVRHMTVVDKSVMHRILIQMPTVDAVPVVRCKDCLHNRACEIQYHAQAGDLFFCGAAERKDGEHDRG